MPIYNYEIINPVVNTKRPFFNNKNGLFIFPISIKYKYYIECAITNENTGNREYYLLLSKTKFDNNCRLCNIDNYGRCQIKVRGEIKDFIIRETKFNGNMSVEYIESTDDYDIYSII